MHISAFNNHCTRHNSLASVSQLLKIEQRHALMSNVKKSVWPLHTMSAETDLKTKRFHLQGEPCPMPVKDDNR